MSSPLIHDTDTTVTLSIDLVTQNVRLTPTEREILLVAVAEVSRVLSTKLEVLGFTDRQAEVRMERRSRGSGVMKLDPADFLEDDDGIA